MALRVNQRASSECPLLALSGHSCLHRTCPLLGAKRTCLFALHVSAYDPKRTSEFRCTEWFECRVNHVTRLSQPLCLITLLIEYQLSMAKLIRVSSAGVPYEKIISCNLLYGSRLRPHGLRRPVSHWQGQSSGSGSYQGLINSLRADTLCRHPTKPYKP